MRNVDDTPWVGARVFDVTGPADGSAYPAIGSEPVIGAIVDYFPSDDDRFYGVRPAVIEHIEADGGGGTVDLRVFARRTCEGVSRVAVIGATEWMARSVMDATFRPARTPYWAWPDDGARAR